ncbi:MAG: DUF726 domain-containing protein [Calditrichaeota bacterium]|nr:DUF726 domain-containing protein [Calditrichota bacterium]
MLIISSRKNFDDPDNLSKKGHLFKKIDLTSDSEIKDFKNEEEFIDEIKKQRVLLIVHGYNNEQDEVYDAYSVIESKVNQHLQNEYDLVIGYSWPGGDKGLEWWSSKRRANSVARRFRRLIENISEKVETLDIMSHSLGARVVLKALKQSEKTKIIKNYFCLAAAVDNEVLEKGEEFVDSVSKIDALFVFHSKKDEVLATVYRLAEFDNALGLHGPEDKDYIENKTKNIFVVNCKKKIKNHGGYKRSDAMYGYIQEIHLKKPLKFFTL